MPKGDRPGPAFNAAARNNSGWEVVKDLFNRDLTPALEVITGLPARNGRQYCAEIRTMGIEACCLSVAFGTFEEIEQCRRQQDKPHPVVQLLATCKDGALSFQVTNFNAVPLRETMNIFGQRPTFLSERPKDFAAVLDVLRQDIGQLCPEYRQEVDKAFKSLTAILLFKPLRLKTAAVNPVRA